MSADTPSRYSIIQRGITIHEELRSLDPIQIDSSAIQQAVLNVVKNARQAVADGGRIDVAVRTEGHSQVISITDDGVGMESTTAQLAFDPFFSARHESPGVELAAGLGLSISNGLIESHGGTIISSRPGHGTTVEIRLPAGQPDMIDESRGGG